MKILLTGATGFIGRYLLSELKNRYGQDAVVAISSRAIDGVHTHVIKNRRSFDLASADFSNIEIIVHAGAYTPKDGAQANDIVACNDNVMFTEQLLSLSLPALKKIVNLSTLDVYAPAQILSEVSPVGPVSLYGYSKYYCEKMVSEFAKKGSISHITLRVGHVYGPGEEVYQKLIPATMKKAISGEPIELWGRGSCLRSFIHVSDVAKAVANAIEPTAVDLVNLVSGTAHPVEGVIEKIISYSGKALDVKRINSDAPGRDLVFDNTLLKAHLLQDELDFDKALHDEYRYLERKLC